MILSQPRPSCQISENQIVENTADLSKALSLNPASEVRGQADVASQALYGWWQNALLAIN
jgi:hypothetical protein